MVKGRKSYKKRDPDGFKETKERVEEEKEALREQFEDELAAQENYESTAWASAIRSLWFLIEV